MSDLGWHAQDEERIALSALPGMAYAKALALRAEETAKKDSKHEGSAEALREAVLTFPYVLPLLADKGACRKQPPSCDSQLMHSRSVGFSIPSEHRSHPLFERHLGYECVQPVFSLRR